jgi:hypothetical protein
MLTVLLRDAMTLNADFKCSDAVSVWFTRLNSSSIHTVSVAAPCKVMESLQDTRGVSILALTEYDGMLTDHTCVTRHYRCIMLVTDCHV